MSKNKIVSKLRLINEGKWSKIMQSVRKNPQGPFSVVAIENGKVVAQKISITDPQIIPAHYEEIKRKHPSARISIENGEGLSVYNESVSEGTISPDELEKNTDELVKAAKNSLGIDDAQAKDYVSGFIGEDELSTGSVESFDIQNRVNEIIKKLQSSGIEVNVENIVVGSLFSAGGTLAGYENSINNIINKSNVSEINQEVLDKFIKQYGEDKGKQIYYATANKQDRSSETFHTEGEHDSVGRGIEAGMNPEVEADKYEEYRALMAQLAAEEGGEQPVREEDVDNQTNDPVKLKADVEKLMSKLDISSIAPYLAKIDNPTEQAEVIAQFSEKIGVPKAKLSSVIAQLKTVAENVKPKMTKDKLIEAVTGRKIIKTIKVKDIK